MNEKTRYIISTWGVAFVTFLVIAVLCIGFIFAPVEESVRDQDGDITVITWGVLGVESGGVIATSWKKYPNYIVGLGTAAFISFSGAVFSVYMIERLRRDKSPDL